MMRTTRHRTWAAAAIALLLTLAACGDDAETRPADAQAEPEEVTNTVQVAATEYAFDVPSKVEGGVVSLELNNEGAEHHEFAFGRLEDGASIEDVLEAMKKSGRTEGVEDLAGVPLLSPGASVTMTRTLDPGSYLFLCMFPTPDFTPHSAKGMYAAFEVDGDAGAEAPEADGAIVATDDGFEVPELEAGTHTIEFLNDGSKPHEFAVYGASEPGATVKDFEKWIGQGQRDDSPLVFPGGMQSIEPGASILQTITFDGGVSYRVEDFPNRLEAEFTIP